MSEQGKLFRGEAYYNMRNKIGDYPKEDTYNYNKIARQLKREAKQAGYKSASV